MERHNFQQPIRTMCTEAKVSRQSAYDWASRLEAAADIVFGTDVSERIRDFERRENALKERIFDLEGQVDRLRAGDSFDEEIAELDDWDEAE